MMTDQTGTTDGTDGTDDVETIESNEEMLAVHPLIRLFGDHGKTRILVALLNVAPSPLNPTAIVDRAGLGSRQSWYEYREELLDSGLIVEDGHAGNSPLYRVATSDEEGDPRLEWLQNLEDYTGAVYRDGERPSK